MTLKELEEFGKSVVDAIDDFQKESHLTKNQAVGAMQIATVKKSWEVGRKDGIKSTIKVATIAGCVLYSGYKIYDSAKKKYVEYKEKRKKAEEAED